MLHTVDEEALAREQAKSQAKDMPLSVVRLSFQAFLQDSNEHFTQVLPCVVSNAIYDSSM